MEKGPGLIYDLTRGPPGPISSAGPRHVVELTSRTDLASAVVADIVRGRTITTIRGERGVGKTTLTLSLEFTLRQNGFSVIRIKSGRNKPLQVQKDIDDALGTSFLNAASSHDLMQVMRGKGKIVLIFDDAESIPRETIYYIWSVLRLMSFGEALFYIVLIGGLSPWTGLDHPDFTELRRLADWSVLLKPLDDAEAELYLQEKMQLAGRSLRQVMTKAAAAELLEQTCGIPDRIDALAESVLARGYWTGEMEISLSTVGGVFRDDDNTFDDTEDGAPSAPRWASWRTACEVALIIAGVAGFPSQVSRRVPASDGGQPVQMVTAASNPLPAPARPPPAPAEPADTIAAAPAAHPPGPALERQSAVVQPGEQQRAGGLGLALLADKGDTLLSLYSKVYQGTTPPPYSAVAAINHERVRPGTIVVFPAPPGGWARQ